MEDAVYNVLVEVGGWQGKELFHPLPCQDEGLVCGAFTFKGVGRRYLAGVEGAAHKAYVELVGSRHDLSYLIETVRNAGVAYHRLPDKPFHPVDVHIVQDCLDRTKNVGSL